MGESRRSAAEHPAPQGDPRTEASRAETPHSHNPEAGERSPDRTGAVALSAAGRESDDPRDDQAALSAETRGQAGHLARCKKSAEPATGKGPKKSADESRHYAGRAGRGTETGVVPDLSAQDRYPAGGAEAKCGSKAPRERGGDRRPHLSGPFVGAGWRGGPLPGGEAGRHKDLAQVPAPAPATVVGSPNHAEARRVRASTNTAARADEGAASPHTLEGGDRKPRTGKRKSPATGGGPGQRRGGAPVGGLARGKCGAKIGRRLSPSRGGDNPGPSEAHDGRGSFFGGEQQLGRGGNSCVVVLAHPRFVGRVDGRDLTLRRGAATPARAGPGGGVARGVVLRAFKAGAWAGTRTTTDWGTRTSAWIIRGPIIGGRG